MFFGIETYFLEYWRRSRYNRIYNTFIGYWTNKYKLVTLFFGGGKNRCLFKINKTPEADKATNEPVTINVEKPEIAEMSAPELPLRKRMASAVWHKPE